MPADFYILWGGYDGVLANYRNLLVKSEVPHLLCEYSGIQNLYHFDTALNGEAKFVKKKFRYEGNQNFDLIENILKDKIITDSSLPILQESVEKYKHIFSYFGMWDWAAGLNENNSATTIKNISAYYSSSYEALQDVVNNLPDNSLLIIKPHPHDSVDNKEKFKSLASIYKNILYITDEYNASQIIDISDVVITIASTINIEVIYKKKPLILLGDTYSSVSSYPYHISTYKNLYDCMCSATKKENWQEKLTHRKSFLLSFILNAEVYSGNEELNLINVKNINTLANTIINKLPADNDQVLSFSQNTGMIKFIGKLIDELGDNQNILEDYTASLNDRTKRLENVLGDFKLLKVESDLLKDKVNIYMNAKCILFGRKFF